MSPVLKLHKKICYTCKYYRVYGESRDYLISRCLNLGMDLAQMELGYHSWCDKARYCALWEKRPEDWLIFADKNPYWHDQYIPREEQLLLPGRRLI